MAKSEKNGVDRRKFLKGAAVGSIATLVGSTGAVAAQQAPAAKAPVAVLRDSDPVGDVEVLTTDRPGSDFMVDVIKSLGFEYVAAVPGSSFRSLHESLINYGGNKAPELITCCHEESSVNIAHGYAEVEGKPMLALVHATVGLQHASMAVFDAWAGQTPVYIIIGNTLDETVPHVTAHAAPDVASMVRDFTKWDDTPVSLAHFADSGIRAYKYAMTFPRGPVVLSVDSELQETPIAKDAALRVPKLTLDTAPQADSGSIAELARLLVAAENPVIMAGRVAHSQEGMDHFSEFAEALQAPVLDRGGNLPLHHPLSQDGGREFIQNADLILALNADNLWGATHAGRDQLVRTSRQISKPGVKMISITTADLYARSNFSGLPRYADLDMAIAADPEVTLPVLTEAIKRLLTDDRKRALQDRGKRCAEVGQKALERARSEAVNGWDSSPISLRRISAEVWEQVKNEDWATVTRETDPGFLDFQWKADKYYRRSNSESSSGVGFVLPAAVGAALAHKKHGRLFVYQQTDGDFMFVPGSLWTAAHHQIPMLAIMHNNRAYHQEVMHVQRMAARHNRGVDRAGIGTKLENPNIDYAKLAQSLGVYSEGPISNPNDLGPAIKRAIAVVKKGEPALVDVITQPR